MPGFGGGGAGLAFPAKVGLPLLLPGTQSKYVGLCSTITVGGVAGLLWLYLFGRCSPGGFLDGSLGFCGRGTAAFVFLCGERSGSIGDLFNSDSGSATDRLLLAAVLVFFPVAG